jgi:phage tail sheath protein FI
MATLVSPGVSVSVINESFFFPATASTVPLFFIATRAGKTQPNGVTPAVGTLESGVVRTVTSLTQSIELFGIPYFRNDVAGNEFHGDARNEYGLLALNQFLGTGARAYVVRADIDLDDEQPETFVALGVPQLVSGSILFSGVGNGAISSIAVTNTSVRPQVFTATFSTPTSYTVRGSVSGYVGIGTVGAAFSSTRVNFTISAGSTPFESGDRFSFAVDYQAVADGGNVGDGEVVGLATDELAVAENWTITFTSATTFNVVGTVSGSTGSGVINTPYDNNRINFSIVDGAIPFQAGDEFTIAASLVTVVDPLGANDAARRVAIVAALQAAINSNTEVRSELYEFNLVACPGYHEVADELSALVVDVGEEAMAVCDVPCTLTPEQAATWAMTSARVRGTNIAYYYPWCVVSNLDGRNVLAAPSGTALRTIAYSDDQSYVWLAPAGVNRGIVSGVAQVGYVSGALGGPTTFVEANLNQGQRDILYEYDKNINPIVFFPGRGILVWGQKTSASAASALDRINVVRLLCYLRRTMRKGAFPFVFEPNDQITRDNLKAAADGVLNDILTKRGLFDFATLCDTSNNTPTRIDRNELYLDIAIKPTRAAEFIYIPIRVVATNAEI